VESQCEVCHQELPSNETLLKHINKYHPELALFSCTMCPMQFCSEPLYNIHRKTHFSIIQGAKRYNCEKCPLYFYALGLLRCHQRKMHPLTKDFKPICAECCKVFEFDYELKNHMEIHLTCSVCGTISPNKYAFKAHNTKNNHHNEPITFLPNPEVKNETPAIEQKVPAVINFADRISNSKPGEKRFYCELCLSSYCHLSSLRLHRHKVHSLFKDFKPTCPECSKVFETEEEMLIHIDAHFACNVCRISFTDKRAYSDHIKRWHLN
jgi:hypothetical protein